MPDSKKIASLDYWRALAILFVVVWHFKPIGVEFGRIGVEVFFVLSGFLVSRSLVHAFLQGHPIPWRYFAVSRFLRILPSYFFFLFAGTLICYWVFQDPVDNVLIPVNAWPSYLFLYKNYNTYAPRAFSHIWTLCVEEHFYIFLPILFLALKRFGKRVMLATLSGLLILGLASRYTGFKLFFERNFSLYFSDPAATHNNFDALLYGVLLRFITELGIVPRSKIQSQIVFVAGLLIATASTFYATRTPGDFYYRVLLKSVDSISIALMMWASLGVEFSKLKILRKISAVSYNWYLWHLIFILIVHEFIGQGLLAFVVYFIASFAVASLTTRFIEQLIDKKIKPVLLPDQDVKKVAVGPASEILPDRVRTKNVL